MTSGTETGDHLVLRPGPAAAAVRKGDAVMAEDGVVGHVEELVRSEALAPAYLIVRANRTLRRRYPVVPVSLISRVDPRRRLVELRGRREAIRGLPETVPLVL
jgi:hypothetical protein